MLFYLSPEYPELTQDSATEVKLFGDHQGMDGWREGEGRTDVFLPEVDQDPSLRGGGKVPPGWEAEEGPREEGFLHQCL